MTSIAHKYPTVDDLQARAKKRLPHVSHAYLETGTGDERAVARNLERMAEVTLVPKLLKGEIIPTISTTLFGQEYAAPFGVAPIGLTGLIWPRTEPILAKTAQKYRIPYCLSTVASQTPETIGPIAGDMGWFQLYPPRDKAIRDDLLERVKSSGFTTLVVTADVPMPSRRERMLRAGLRMPPAITPNFVFQAITHPHWTAGTLREGLPSLKTMEKYADTTDMADLAKFVGHNIGGNLSWDYLREVREQWSGPLVLKGILHPDDVAEAIAVGVDGVSISNHGGRQFNGAPAAIDVLPSIAEQFKGRTTILFDSGVRSGLDILRAIALGADFVLLGRAFMYGVAALGDIGGDHVVDILIDDLKNNMVQIGVSTLDEAREQHGS
ncbi:MAG: alpha-hydroxy acid oxidase [Chloroflexota bacterium]